MELLSDTEVTGIEVDGIKITRDPFFKRAIAKQSDTMQNRKDYVSTLDETRMWNAMHNPDWKDNI